jgi:secreted PhoX family phosphatase
MTINRLTRWGIAAAVLGTLALAVGCGDDEGSSGNEGGAAGSGEPGQGGKDGASGGTAGQGNDTTGGQAGQATEGGAAGTPVEDGGMGGWLGEGGYAGASTSEGGYAGAPTGEGGEGGAVVEYGPDYRKPPQTAAEQLLTANGSGLSLKYLTRSAAQDLDMMALYPASNPTHLIACIEGAPKADIGNGKANPSVQRINLATGAVETVLRGMDRCDGIRTTPWGTILATEEVTDGGAYEILNPLTATDLVVKDRAAGTIQTGAGADASAQAAKRSALPTMAWEGLEVLPSGVVVGGDELRPGDAAPDADGGAIFKFVPTTLRTANGHITQLSESPLVAGKTYAMRVYCSSSPYGQGCEVGQANWQEVAAASARMEANTKGATGYYRPEDLHLDPTFPSASGMRFCWTNTGNEGAKHWGEVMCAVDAAPDAAGSSKTVTVTRFISGDMELSAVDNLAFQPGTGILYVIEDDTNGDIWACLPDGTDRDVTSDGCARVFSVFDESAEPTGFLFSQDGKKAWVSIQHSKDGNMPLVDGYATDDLIEISGFGAVDATAVASFGADRQQDLESKSASFLGFGAAVAASAPNSAEEYRTTTVTDGKKPSDGVASFGDDATAQVLIAGGLVAQYTTRYAAENLDMFDFWPAGSSVPTHLVACIEGGVDNDIGNGKRNPSVQVIDLATGAVRTILRGMDRCDGIRTTPWGTVVATEEVADGAAYEILNPMDTTEYVITSRGGAGLAATIVGPGDVDATDKVVKRIALPTMRWEGLHVFASGVVVGGDELRPGEGPNGADSDGGAIFKFVPSTLRVGSGSIAALSESPLAAGKAYAMQVSCVDSKQQFGQGCEIGNAAWVEVSAATAPKDADDKGATGYYRPEDLHADPSFAGPGARFCWTNTGNQGVKNWSEVVCAVDAQIDAAPANTRSVIVTRFIEGDTQLNSADNLAFQPGTGILYVIEDNGNGDVWACLPDGDDRDVQSDGCVRMLSVKDTSAEPTGFIFHPNGKKAYVSVQHSNDDASADTSDPRLVYDGYGTDDLVEISGFATPSATGFGKLWDTELNASTTELFGVKAALAASARQPN